MSIKLFGMIKVGILISTSCIPSDNINSTSSILTGNSEVNEDISKSHSTSFVLVTVSGVVKLHSTLFRSGIIFMSGLTFAKLVFVGVKSIIIVASS